MLSIAYIRISCKESGCKLRKGKEDIDSTLKILKWEWKTQTWRGRARTHGFAVKMRNRGYSSDCIKEKIKST